MRAACRTLPAFGFAFCATALLLAGCGNAQEQVADHRFDVPDANLIPTSAYPFFLRRSKDAGFIFYLNPQAELGQRRTVLVESRDSICTRANGGGYISRTVCAPQKIAWQGVGWLRQGDDVFWTYSPDTPAGANAHFVSCHSMEIEGHPGLCHATLAFEDLVLTIGLEDDELPALEATYQQAVSLLRKWEV
jgi:hypothetical protein